MDDVDVGGIGSDGCVWKTVGSVYNNPWLNCTAMLNLHAVCLHSRWCVVFFISLFLLRASAPLWENKSKLDIRADHFCRFFFRSIKTLVMFVDGFFAQKTIFPKLRLESNLNGATFPNYDGIKSLKWPLGNSEKCQKWSTLLAIILLRRNGGKHLMRYPDLIWLIWIRKYKMGDRERNDVDSFTFFGRKCISAYKWQRDALSSVCDWFLAIYE